MRLGWHTIATRSARHDGASGWAPPMPPSPAVDPAAGKIAAIVPATHLHERIVCPLNDALGADIDPGPAVIWPYIIAPSISS